MSFIISQNIHMSLIELLLVLKTFDLEITDNITIDMRSINQLFKRLIKTNFQRL